jgi:ABC-2 type transport system permease protein
MAGRYLRNLLRQPWYIAFTLIQPMVWLLLFGELFKSVTKIPGFGAVSYIAFLTPGVVVMTALFSGGWSGMSVVEDLDRGVMDRFLVSPVSRASIILGRLVQLAAVTVIQATIVIAVGYLRGASFANAIGLLVVVVAAILLALPFAALSNAIALLLRREESVIGASNFILLPLSFLSTVFMARQLLPAWMQSFSKYNPVDWAVSASRSALQTNPDWGYVAGELGWLMGLTIACTWLATRAFRVYQRSL